MNKSRLLLSIFMGHMLLSSLYAEESEEMDNSCHSESQSMRATLRHIESNGIGYNEGYTTLEGFFSTPSPYKDKWMPFLDLRGHVFDSGKLAANAGAGLRYLQSSRLFGLNAYYDYRKTHRQHYNQVSVGLEMLGRIWDARLNGYLPVGAKTSSFYATDFSHFAGNSVYLSSKKEFAMKGINAEAGFHVDHFKHIPLYFTAGPYYLNGQGNNAWGGQLRASAHLYDYIKIEGNTSYDNVFRWVGQGQLSLVVSFGGKKKARRFISNSCSKSKALNQRMRQPVDRFEIIPVDKKKYITQAINPATGSPWVFWFVNNTSNSLGTYASPFSRLINAQNASLANQAIYIFPGDGTARNMDQGIVLKNGQMLLGASTSHVLATTLGAISIPSFAGAAPLITNTNPSDVVTFANDNTVAGFSILMQQANHNGFSGSSIFNLHAFANNFTTTTTNNYGIYLNNASGDVVVKDNTFSSLNTGIYTDGNIETLQVTGNTFQNFSSGNGVYNNGILKALYASGNTFQNFSNTGAAINNANVLTNLAVTGNTFQTFSDLTVGIYNDNTKPIKIFYAKSNIFKNFIGQTTGIYNEGNITTLAAVSNIFDGYSGGGNGIYTSGLVSNLAIMENVFTNFSGGLQLRCIDIEADNGLSQSAIIANNIFSSQNTANGYGVYIAVYSGIYCLDFVNNKASPTSSPNPYFFTQVGGVFNLSSQSTQQNNIGTIQTQGAVGSPGSCSH